MPKNKKQRESTTIETENADSMSSSESTLGVWGQESAFEQAGGGGGGAWASWARKLGQQLHLFVLWLLCVSGTFSNLFLCLQSPLVAWVRGSPPWMESHTHPFLLCHQPQWAHSAARADPGAWSPAWSRPDQKGDSQVFNQPGTWEFRGTRSHVGLCQDPF